MFIHEWKYVNFILFNHLPLTSSCYLWSELFRYYLTEISIGILTERTQCFSSQDRGQGHKRSCSCCRNHVVCVILFSVSSTLLRSPFCRLGVGLIHQREKAHVTYSVSDVYVRVSFLSRCTRRLQCTNVRVSFPYS